MGETPTGDTIRFRLPKPKSSGDWAAILAALGIVWNIVQAIAPREAQAAPVPDPRIGRIEEQVQVLVTDVAVLKATKRDK